MAVVRRGSDVRVVGEGGYRYCRHLGALDEGGEPDPSGRQGFGALRLLDDVVVRPRSHLLLEAHDGFEVVIYVLEGRCLIEDDRGGEQELLRDCAAHLVLGRGIRHDVSNLSSTKPLHLFLAAVAGPVANPRPRRAVASFGRAKGRVVWVASFDAEDHGTLRLDSSVRLGVATLEPGVGVEFAPASDRGLFVSVLQGSIAFGSGFVDEGGDATSSREGLVRVQGITKARIVVADVDMELAPGGSGRAS
jgi:redox-sensitive bicupin YhaK (pirin superfamily)